MSFTWGQVADTNQNDVPASMASAQKEVEAGHASLKAGDVQKALKLYRKAMREVEHNVSAKGCEMRLSVHIMIGDLFLKVNKPIAAQDEFVSALSIDSKCVKAVLHRAQALIALGSMDDAERELNRAKEMSPQNEEVGMISSSIENCLDNDNNLASCLAFIDAGDYEQAVVCLQKIVDTAHSLGATRQVAHGCSYIGIVMQRMEGQHAKAVEWHQRHNQLAEGLRDTEERCRALSNLGSSYTLTKQPHKAIACQEEQLELMKETRSQKDLCRFYGNMSISYRAVKNFERAVECHQRSLQIAIEEGDALLQCMCYHQLGKTYRAMEKLEFAANCHKEGVIWAKKTKLDPEICRELHELGCVRMLMGSHAEALKAFKEELAIISKFADMKLEGANVKANIGLCHASMGQWEEAAECFDEHLQVATDYQDAAGQGQSNRNLEEAYRTMGDPDKALERGMANLKLAMSAENKNDQAKAHSSIARTLATMGSSTKAADSFRHALKCAKEGGGVLQQGAALVGLGLVLLEARAPRLDIAIEALRRGQGVLEELLADVSSHGAEREELLRQSILCARALQIALLQRAAPQDLTEALSIAIQAQATDTLIAMGEAKVLPWDELEDDLDPSPMSWPELQELSEHTGCGVLVLSLLDDHGTLAAWGWTSRWPAPAVRVIEHQTLLSRVAGSWGELLSKLHDPAMAAEGGGQGWRETMQALYEVLWAPVADLVEGWDRILIAPQRELALLPWGALLDPQGSPLVMKHAFILEPSLQCLQGVLKGRAESVAAHSALSTQAVVVSDPFVMGRSEQLSAREEGQLVGAALRAQGQAVRELCEEAATFSAVRAAAAGAGWVHLAVPLEWIGEQDQGRGRGQLVLAEGEVDGVEVGKGGEKEPGLVTAQRIGQEWARGLLGAELVVAGRAREHAQPPRDDEEGPEPPAPGPAAAGPVDGEAGESGAVDVWSWLALVGALRLVGGAMSLAFPLAECSDEVASDLIKRVYRAVGSGAGLHMSVTTAMREVASASRAAGGWEWCWLATIGPRPSDISGRGRNAKPS